MVFDSTPTKASKDRAHNIMNFFFILSIIFSFVYSKTADPRVVKYSNYRALNQDDIETLNDFSKIRQKVGIGAMWWDAGLGLRKAINPELPVYPVGSTTGTVLNSLSPALGFSTFLLLLVKFLVIYAIVSACSACCCLRKKKIMHSFSSPSWVKFSIAWIAVSCMLFFLSLLGGFGATKFFPVGFDFMQESSTSLFTDIVKGTGKLSAVVDEGFDNFNASLQTAVAEMKDVITAPFNTQLSPSLSVLEQALRNLTVELSDLIAAGDQLEKKVFTMQSIGVKMDQSAEDSNALIETINSNFSLLPQHKYSALIPSFQNFERNINLSRAVDPLRIPNVPNFNDTADSVHEKYNGSFAEFESVLKNLVNDFEIRLNENTKAKIDDAVASAQIDIYTAISDIPVKTADYISIGQHYGFILQIIQGCYFAIVLVSLLSFLVSIRFKKPKVLKACSCISTLLWIIALLIAITVFLIATVFGALCSAYFDFERGSEFLKIKILSRISVRSGGKLFWPKRQSICAQRIHHLLTLLQICHRAAST